MITTVLIVFLVTGNATFHHIQFSMPFLVSWILVLIGYYFPNCGRRNLYPWLVDSDYFLPQECLLSHPHFFYHVLLLPLEQQRSFLALNRSPLLFSASSQLSMLEERKYLGTLWLPLCLEFPDGKCLWFHVSGFDSESSLMYFTTSNHTLITGGEFGPEGGIPGLVVCILALLWAIFILKDTSKEQDSLYPAPLK